MVRIRVARFVFSSIYLNLIPFFFTLDVLLRYSSLFLAIAQLVERRTIEGNSSSLSIVFSDSLHGVLFLILFFDSFQISYTIYSIMIEEIAFRGSSVVRVRTVE